MFLINQGLVQIYLGNTKFRNLTALGMAIRASGHGIKSNFLWLTKPEFEIPKEMRAFISNQKILYPEIRNTLNKKNSIIIMPNILDLLTEEQILKILLCKNADSELILTGTNCSKALREKVDLVTNQNNLHIENKSQHFDKNIL